ncbi:MAG: alpha/beta fold hydrolase [Dehalococcoidia bacterium]
MTAAQQTGQIRSPDGTPIGYRRTGAGTPLVLVHGGAADGTRWGSVLPALEERFIVYAVDRRGRGLSGDTSTHSIAQESDDIGAVVNSIGGPVDLLGHSYGALLALEAARRSDSVRRLVLYEPPIPTGTPLYSAATLDRMQALIDAGERDAMLATFFRDVVGMPEDELSLIRAQPVWQARVAAAHTIPRELRSIDRYDFKPERFKGMRTPCLLLFGGDSPAFLKDATAAVRTALSASRIAVMPGQQHIAMNTAPDLFLREVLGFLTADR